jgi:hypothetical protein
MVLQALGYLWFTRFGHINSIVLVVVQQLLVGTGFAAVYPSLNIAAVRNARPEEQGLASGMFIAAVQIGSGIVLAVVARYSPRAADLASAPTTRGYGRCSGSPPAQPCSPPAGCSPETTLRTWLSLQLTAASRPPTDAHA